MLKKGLIYAVMTLMCISFAQAQQEGKEKVIVVHDTIYIERSPVAKLDSADIIRTKAIGRFDRGIVNYRFIPKNKWLGGLTFSYVNMDTDDSRLLFSILKDIDCSFRTLSVKPFIGYAIKDNIVIGAKMGYNHTVAGLGNISLNIDEDLSYELKDMRYDENSYTIGVFHRSYVGLDRDKRFGFFNETTLSYNSGSTTFSRGEGDTMKKTETTINELHVGLNPGVVVFIMENVCAEVSLGVVGFKYRSEKQKNNEGEVGTRRSSGANFKINLFNINIGITLCL